MLLFIRIGRHHTIGRRGLCSFVLFFFSSRRRHTRCSRDWSSDVCSSDLQGNWTVYNTANGLPSNWINCLLETVDENGHHLIWAGTEGGLACFQDGVWRTYNTTSGLANNLVRSLLEVKSRGDTLWIGTS